jgi:hypothetical protein
MKLAAHQPQYLPWLGYFDKMDRADLFVLLDTVQYKKNEWQNRNRIRTATGWQWLTVPVHYRFPMTMRWRRKHREAMRIHYARTPFFRPTFTEIEAILDASFENLSELNTRTIEVLAALLGVRTPVVLASSLGEIPMGADNRLIALCRRFGCATYLAGAGGQHYMDMGAYRSAGIEVKFQDFRHPVYRQAHPGFETALSAVDCLMNRGADALHLIRETREVAA